MSCDERNTGILRPLRINADFMHAFEEYAEEKEYEISDPEEWGYILDDAWEDGLIDNQIVNINGVWYEVLHHVRTTDIYGARFNRLDNGLIKFDSIHHNGGGHWTEVLSDVLPKEN